MIYIIMLIKIQYYKLLLTINSIHNFFITGKWFNTISQNSIGDVIADARSDALVSKHRTIFFKRGKIIDKLMKIQEQVKPPVPKVCIICGVEVKMYDEHVCENGGIFE